MTDMEQHPEVQRMRQLEKTRLAVMEKHQGADSEEEDAVLEDMDAVWWSLSKEVRDHLNQNPGPYHEQTIYWIDHATD